MNHARLVGIAIGLLIIASPEAGEKKGKIRDGVFKSPLGDFAVRVPQLAFGTRVDQRFHEHGGSLAFYSDIGEVYMIQSQEAAPSIAAVVGDPERETAALRRYLDEYYLPEMLRKAAPRTEIIHGERVTLGSRSAYFAVASMPEGSVAQGASVVQGVLTAKPMDDTRGLLVLIQGKYIYVLSVGGGGDALGAPKTPPPIEETTSTLRKRVDGFYAKVEFTKP